MSKRTTHSTEQLIKMVSDRVNNLMFEKIEAKFSDWMGTDVAHRNQLAYKAEGVDAMYFDYNGTIYPFVPVSSAKLLHPSLQAEVNREYDKLRQIRLVEANVYNHLIRKAWARMQNLNDMVALLPKAMGTVISQMFTMPDKPVTLSPEAIAEFQKDNAMAFGYYKRRMLGNSIGTSEIINHENC